MRGYGCAAALVFSFAVWALIALAVKALAAPPTPYRLTADARAFREQTYLTHPCLAAIVDLEDGWWDPTVDYGGGHGDTAQSYGLGQANPGTKMASAGSDWRTSRATQLRWLRSYAVTRYGSECAALAHRRTHRSY